MISRDLQLRTAKCNLRLFGSYLVLGIGTSFVDPVGGCVILSLGMILAIRRLALHRT